MGQSRKFTEERLSTRVEIQAILARAEHSFRSALQLFGDNARVEDVRQARLNLALLYAFQTSLQHGSETVTASAADILGKHAAKRTSGRWLTTFQLQTLR
jgi:hypothetical protein